MDKAVDDAAGEVRAARDGLKGIRAKAVADLEAAKVAWGTSPRRRPQRRWRTGLEFTRA